MLFRFIYSSLSISFSFLHYAHYTLSSYSTFRSIETEGLRAKYAQLQEEFESYKEHVSLLPPVHGTPGSGEKGSHSAPSSPRPSGHASQSGGGAFSDGVPFFSTTTGTPVRNTNTESLPTTVDEEGGEGAGALRNLEAGGDVDYEQIRIETEKELEQYKSMYDEQMAHIDSLSNQKGELESRILKLTTEIDTLKEEGTYSLLQELSTLKQENENLKQLVLSTPANASDALSPVPESGISIRTNESMENFDRVEALKNEIDECNHTISDLQRQLAVQVGISWSSQCHKPTSH